MNPPTVFIAKPKTNEQINALKAFMQALKIKYDVADENTYSSEIVDKIEESREQYKKGEYISIDKKDIKDFLGLE